MCSERNTNTSQHRVLHKQSGPWSLSPALTLPSRIHPAILNACTFRNQHCLLRSLFKLCLHLHLENPSTALPLQSHPSKLRSGVMFSGRSNLTSLNPENILWKALNCSNYITTISSLPVFPVCGCHQLLSPKHSPGRNSILSYQAWYLDFWMII